jgi:hypothetical protein
VKPHTKTITIMIVAALIAISFLIGVKSGIDRSRSRLSKTKTEISILRTKLSSQEWIIADEKRKNAAFQEVIEMEMGK